MNKISLNGVNTKKFISLLKRSSSMDNLIFITLNGSEFESTAYNKTKSALKAVYANLEKVCDCSNNPFDGPVKIQFANANKLIQVLSLAGNENVSVVFDVEDNNYAKKVYVTNDEVNLTVACADKAAVDFLEIPEANKKSIFEDMTNLQYSISINDNEFKYLSNLFSLDKDSVRVFFNLTDGEVYVSEIESTDENVRSEVNEIINESNYEAFQKYEKLYSKKLNLVELDNPKDLKNHLACYNKLYFDWIDNDKFYYVEFHSNKVKFISYNDEDVKTYVILTPVRFA